MSRSRFRPKTGVDKNAPVLEKSRGLLFHCHGGGWVAQSSQSHEVRYRFYRILVLFLFIEFDMKSGMWTPDVNCTFSSLVGLVM